MLDYIDGVPIDVYSRELDLRGNFRLFLEVCDAVAYARRNLIIHGTWCSTGELCVGPDTSHGRLGF